MASRGSRSGRKNKGSGLFVEAGKSLKEQRLSAKQVQAEQVRLAAVQWMADTAQMYADRLERALILQQKHHEKSRLIREAAEQRRARRKERYLSNVARVRQQQPTPVTRPVVRPNGVRARGDARGCGASFRLVQDGKGNKVLQRID